MKNKSKINFEEFDTQLAYFNEYIFVLEDLVGPFQKLGLDKVADEILELHEKLQEVCDFFENIKNKLEN